MDSKKLNLKQDNTINGRVIKIRPVSAIIKKACNIPQAKKENIIR